MSEHDPSASGIGRLCGPWGQELPEGFLELLVFVRAHVQGAHEGMDRVRARVRALLLQVGAVQFGEGVQERGKAAPVLRAGRVARLVGSDLRLPLPDCIDFRQRAVHPDLAHRREDAALGQQSDVPEDGGEWHVRQQSGDLLRGQLPPEQRGQDPRSGRMGDQGGFLGWHGWDVVNRF